ncbi:MAG: family 43 glycosylhydrolase, partial [Actinomycetes bacterium]
MTHALRRTAATLAAAALALLATPGTASAAQWQGDPRDLPDPSVLVVEQPGQPRTYYAYATQIWQQTNVQVTVSTDLKTWSAPTEALPTLGSWATTGNTWAPGALRRGDQFLLYYTATHAASGRQCIGVATSATPTGPFTDSSPAPLVCQLALGGSIDADTLVMPDGTLYLHWKSDDNAIGGVAKLWGQRLAGNGLSFEPGTSPRELLRYDARWEKPLIEG